MNEQQLEIIRSFGKGQAVVAGAGCGKTTTLVAKCIALVRNRPDARFCAVSFTEKSVRDLRESLKKGFLKEGFAPDVVKNLERHHWIKTIHGLCLSLVQEFPLESGLSGGESLILEDESETLWNRSLYILWTRNENPEISSALSRLLKLYSKNQLETNFRQLKSLVSFGVEHWIERLTKDRPEVQDLWLTFESVYARFQQWKLKSGQMDFNDLELFARRALSHPRVRSYFHQRFDLVLVDEFQDTNPIQGDILESFVRPGFENLCIVGDPKQSIYRFRDADVSVFQDLISKLPQKHLLDVNYRSVPGIIQFVNSVCNPLFQASSMDYEPLRPGRDQDSSHAEEPAEPHVLRLSVEDEHGLARFLQGKMNEGLDLSEYVILARSVRREKTQKILRSLDEKGVPYLLGSGGRFYSDARVRELIAFLKGWSSPNHALSQVMALRSPWIGISGSQLLSWKPDYFGNFFRHSDHPIALALRKEFFDRIPLRPGEVLERIWDALPPGSEMELSLATLWHKLESASSRGKRFEEMIEVLDRFVKDDRLEAEVPPPPAQGMVRIMTIHASKGLQFPRVILLDFEGEYRKPSQSNDFIWNRKKGLHLLIRDDAGDRDSKNELNRQWTEIENQASVAESKRLFYVAITRPQNQLILNWKKEVTSSKSKEPSLLTDHWRNWIELTVGATIDTLSVSSSVESVNPDLRDEESLNPLSDDLVKARSDSSIPQERYRPRHSASEWMMLEECPLRYQKTFLEYPVDFEDSQKIHKMIQEKNRFTESSSEQGSRIHEILEKEDWQLLKQEWSSVPNPDSTIFDLRSFLNTEGVEGWKVYREIAFEIPFTGESMGEEALVGVMDRLEVNSDLKMIRVIDYKWTRRSRTPEQLAEHYRLQLELYVWAAIKLLGQSLPSLSVEVHLVHLHEGGFETIPIFVSLDSLERTVQTHLLKARNQLKKFLSGVPSEARLGEQCGYCDHSGSCIAYQNAAMRNS